MTSKKIELNDNEVDKETGIGDVSGGIQNGTDNASNSVKNAADQANSLQQPNP